MKTLICLLVIVGLSGVLCQNAEEPSSNQGTEELLKDKVQGSADEIQPGKTSEQSEIIDSFEDYNYDDSDETEYWDWDSQGSVPNPDRDVPVPGNEDNSDEIKPEDDSFEDNEDEKKDDTFGDDMEDDDSWLQKDLDIKSEDDSKESDEYPVDSSESSEDETVTRSSWSYGKYLEEQEFIKAVKAQVMRRWIFIATMIAALMVVLLMVVAVMRMRKLSRRQSTPYYTLKEETA